MPAISLNCSLVAIAADNVPPPQKTSMVLNGGFALRPRRIWKPRAEGTTSIRLKLAVTLISRKPSKGDNRERCAISIMGLSRSASIRFETWLLESVVGRNRIPFERGSTENGVPGENPSASSRRDSSHNLGLWRVSPSF